MVQSKKILLLINKLRVGGAERVFIKDARSLTSHGYDVSFAFLYGEEKEQTLLSEVSLPKEKLYYANFKKLADIRAFLKLSEYVQKNNITVVYSTLDEANIVARLLKISKPSLKVIIREANIADPKPLWFKIFDSIFNFFASTIICVSEEVRDSLKKYQPLFASRMKVLMNGVDIPVEGKVYQGVVSPLKILNVGSLNPKKGQKFLIEAIAQVVKEHPQACTLDIFGAGALLDELSQQIKQYSLENVVTIHPPVSSQELSRAYKEADIFVLSSLWEGCPNVLLEAMAHGVAPIATLVSGARSIISNQLVGRLVKKGDSQALASAIIAYMSKPEDLPVIGAQARKNMIENFSWEARFKILTTYL